MTEAIVVDRVTKLYRVGQQSHYSTVREKLESLPARWRRRQVMPTLAALNDVSFAVKEGEVLGIIGANGAGKSTLLKLLARITAPTSGTLRIRGRLGALLEIGTGFHPELTGRENIYLSGAILGLPRRETQAKYAQIVEFAGIGDAVERAVKTYSSGMFMRLAFSVAAHLESDILVLDEILAVGDAAFQAKCLGRMNSLAASGRTVLFVSHQMNAIRTFCSRAIHLSGGRLLADGPPSAVIAGYLANVSGGSAEWCADHAPHSAEGDQFFRPTRLALVDADLRVLVLPVGADAEIAVLIEGVIEQPNSSLTVGFAVSTMAGDVLFWSLQTDAHPDQWPTMKKGHNRLLARLPPHLLNEGDYIFQLIVSLHNQAWIHQPGTNAPGVRLSVRGGLSESPHWIMARPGMLAPVLPFERLADPR
jgi:lipopolysaccharide transport system ATP-binding protein